MDAGRGTFSATDPAAARAIPDHTDLDHFTFLLSGHLDPGLCAEILAEGYRLGVAPHRLLFTNGWITPEIYVRALAVAVGARAVRFPDDAAPTDVLIDATSTSPTDVAAAVAAARRLFREPVLFASALDRDVGPPERIALAAARDAIDALRVAAPVASAGARMWLWQYVAMALILGAVIGGAITAPWLAGEIGLMVSAALFAAIAGFRLLVTLVALLPGVAIRARHEARALHEVRTLHNKDASRNKSARHQRRARTVPLLADADLPTYAILVPLYQEAAILPDLIEALCRLDYPPAKLDIALILEESDRATRAAACRAARPPHMRIVVVPDGQPRTKPKALAAALPLTRGDIVAVFDAEDIPAPGQLRRAASAFAAFPGRYACLQARLAIYNGRQSALTRQFALEYGALFHGLLPALVRLGLPVPLSGTSNHFPRRVLEASGWDPFNVTEDADLGIRLARRGAEIGLLDCETREEAPYTFAQWLPQRTRWIKGWIQTYLVHTRRPWRLLRELGVWRAIGFHVLIGGFLASALMYPLMFVFLALELRAPTPFAVVPGSPHHIALVVAFIDLAVGLFAAVALALVGAMRGRLLALAGHIAAAPLYWLLISAAAYRALLQFIWRPHLWEKTVHTSRSRRKPRHRT